LYLFHSSHREIKIIFSELVQNIHTEMISRSHLPTYRIQKKKKKKIIINNNNKKSSR